MNKTYWVYILNCSDKSYYVGITSNLEKRLWQHRSGLHIGSYTFTRRPLELVHIESFYSVFDAINREKQLKGWRRSKKEALINQNYNELYRLSNVKGAAAIR